MKALPFTAALAALVLTAGCGGGDAGQDAGESVQPNAPPAMTSPATEGDTTVRNAEPGH